jgi:hypothetical protein
MPKFRFKCHNCGEEKVEYASPSLESFPCGKCDSAMIRQFPGSGSQVVKEVIDPFTNVRTAPDEKQQNLARKTEYFWEVEVPRLVQSGTYSVETMLQEGWVVYNDKNELVINKPPSKR